MSVNVCAAGRMLIQHLYVMPVNVCAAGRTLIQHLYVILVNVCAAGRTLIQHLCVMPVNVCAAGKTLIQHSYVMLVIVCAAGRTLIQFFPRAYLMGVRALFLFKQHLPGGASKHHVLFEKRLFLTGHRSNIIHCVICEIHVLSWYRSMQHWSFSTCLPGGASKHYLCSKTLTWWRVKALFVFKKHLPVGASKHYLFKIHLPGGASKHYFCSKYTCLVGRQNSCQPPPTHAHARQAAYDTHTHTIVYVHKQQYARRLCTHGMLCASLQLSRSC